MKQHMSPSQVKEITEEQFYSLFSKDPTSIDCIVRRHDYATFHNKKVTIGKCLEVLEKYAPMLGMKHGVYGLWHLELWTEKAHRMFTGKETIDVLWEGIKATL